MSPPVWVAELAEAFWELAGDEPFPRDLRGPITRALPLSIVELPALHVDTVDAWLARQDVVCAIRSPDRPLRACLVAHHGYGMIFLDRADLPDEQRFSLAHELAHFLRDYWWPRRLAVERFGEEVLEVFDGIRPPHPHERVDALLAKVPIGVHVHLMDREADGEISGERIARAEVDADRLAFELLAPAERVLGEATSPLPQGERGRGRGVDAGRQRAPEGALRRAPDTEVRATLVERYGLPTRQAEEYAAMLVPKERESFTRRLWAVR